MSNKKYKELKISYYHYENVNGLSLGEVLDINNIYWESYSDKEIIIRYTDELQLFEIGYLIGTFKEINYSISETSIDNVD